MTTLAPALVAIGGVEEISVAIWKTRILHVIRRGPDLFLHFEGDSISKQLILPTGTRPKDGITSAVVGNDLMLAWSERGGEGTIRFMRWSLLTFETITGPLTVTAGESPTLVVFRTRKLAMGYARANTNFRRNSSTLGSTWGTEITEDVGSGPLRELDATIRDEAGFISQWAETDAVIIPAEQHFYSMNDADIAGTVLDDLKNNQNGTLVGGVGTVAGYEGQALQFDGVNDEVNLNGVTLASSASWTISAIVRWASLPGAQRAIWDSRAAASQRTSALLIGPTGVTVEVNIQGAINHVGVVVPPVPFYNNRWNRVVVVYDHTRRLIRGFLDGRLQCTRGVSSANVSSSVFRLGASPTVAGMFFTGLIDTVRIWNVALTDRQVAEL